MTSLTKINSRNNKVTVIVMKQTLDGIEYEFCENRFCY